ncbi:MAG: hypothetical protein JSW54_12415, partial [Fidelibacterota bacterium]
METNHRHHTIVFIVLVCYLSVSCRGPEQKEPGSDKYVEAIEYVKTITYPSEFETPTGVVEVHHDRDEPSGVRYIIHDKRGLHFCDSSFQIITTLQTIEATRVLTSRMGKYLLITEYIRVATDKSRIGSRKYTLANYKGKILWTKHEREVWDDLKQVGRCISDTDGNLFEYVDVTSTLAVYDKQGNLLNSYTLFNEEGFRPAYMDISGQGNLVAILANRRYDKEPHLFLFNNDGSIRMVILLEG